MSILIDEKTRVVVSGITGGEGTFHTQRMLEYGTKVVAGMTPGKGGSSHLGVPVYNTAAEAVKEQGANAAAIFVPPFFAADAVIRKSADGRDDIMKKRMGKNSGVIRLACDLVQELRLPPLTRSGGGLISGHDDLFQAELALQRRQRHHHLNGRAVGIGNN